MRLHSAESLLNERLWLNLHRWRGKRKWKHHNLSMSLWRGKMGNFSLVRLQSRDVLRKENWKIFTRAKREWNEGESCQWSACHHESARNSKVHSTFAECAETRRKWRSNLRSRTAKTFLVAERIGRGKQKKASFFHFILHRPIPLAPHKLEVKRK